MTVLPRNRGAAAALLRVLAALFAMGVLIPAQPSHAAPAATQRSYDKGLLWKIEGTTAKPSYLFGTIHSDDARLNTLPPPVKYHFDRSASFTMEALVNGPGLVAMAEAMFFNNDTTLQDVLGPELYQRTVKSMATHGLPEASALKMKPWAAMVGLSQPPTTSGVYLDLALQLEAARQSKLSYGLESMAEQIELFDTLPLDDQVALLRETVANHNNLPRQIEELIQAYTKRDLAGLAAIEQKYKISDARLYHTLMERLIVKRNQQMLERMRPRLHEGNAFIAVGALHLIGGDGLLALLENAGYRVSAVY